MPDKKWKNVDRSSLGGPVKALPTSAGVKLGNAPLGGKGAAGQILGGGGGITKPPPATGIAPPVKAPGKVGIQPIGSGAPMPSKKVYPRGPGQPVFEPIPGGAIIVPPGGNLEDELAKRLAKRKPLI